MGISKHKDSAVGHSDFSEKYWIQFRKHAFTLIKLGYDQLNVNSLREAEETDITGELARSMEDVIQDRNAPKWTTFFSIYDDPPVNVPGRKGKRRPRLDLRIERTSQGRRPSYQFEAKRLGRNNTAGKYAGSDGLGMFTAGIYSRACHEVGMLGYIQQDTVENWADKISKKLLQGGESKSIDGWLDVSIVADLPSYRTQHNRPAVGSACPKTAV